MGDFLKQAGGVVGAIAPTIAAALGGPLAGQAVTALIGAMGMAPGTSPDQVATAILGASPEQLLAIKKADNDFKVQMQQLEVDLDKIAAGDRDSARKMAIETKDRTPDVLSYAYTVGFFGLCGLMAFHEVPAANSAPLNILLGALAGAWLASNQFFFGGTRSGQNKDAFLYQSAPANSGQPVTSPGQTPAAGRGI